MVNSVLQFKMFGSFRVMYHNESYDLEEMLGKQLSGLLAYFIYNCNKTITKDSLINTFWEDSDNPNSAIKYAIHRLRNKLKETEFLDNIIVTQKLGYAVNPDFRIEVDCIELESLVNEGKRNNDLSKIELGLEYYVGRFLSNSDMSWAIINRNYYQNLVMDNSKLLYNQYIKDEDYVKAKIICENALNFDEYNEDVIYAYVNAMIKGRKYNDALKYYDYISKKYQNVMNEPLDERVSSLFALGSLPNKAPELSFDDMHNDEEFHGPLYCDSLSFKKMCEFEYRNYVRNKKRIYIIVLEVRSDNNAKYLEILDNIVAKTLRINDTYARNGSNQLMIMVELANENDEFIVTNRIVDRFYHRVDSKVCRINYYHKSIDEIYD